MNKSILVLDDNSVVHSLIASALDLEGLTIHHEFNPQKFVERANSLMPDLILLGNLRQDPKYSICKALKANPSLKQVPLVMMTGSMDDLGSKALETLKIEGVIRKPFEASDLQQQVSKHLNLADLIGSAFEFRQTQSARSDELNPLANLDVLDEEVTGMLLGTGTPTAPKEAELDEAVLSQTLQPEQAFEAISDSEEVVLEAVEEGEFPQQEAPGVEELGAADLLEEEPYPTQSLEDGDFMVMEDHEPALESVSVEELGPGDLLEDEAPEEMVLSPQSFEQNLAKAPPSGRLPSLEEIEVELDGGPEELEFIDQELAADEVDKLDSGLEEVLAEDVVEN
ncbi:MAG: response regulator, partial [Deltaproteobacteria bacterium]|nr:response regulator [Deltaproteobacteria bacterium]